MAAVFHVEKVLMLAAIIDGLKLLMKYTPKQLPKDYRLIPEQANFQFLKSVKSIPVTVG